MAGSDSRRPFSVTPRRGGVGAGAAPAPLNSAGLPREPLDGGVSLAGVMARVGLWLSDTDIADRPTSSDGDVDTTRRLTGSSLAGAVPLRVPSTCRSTGDVGWHPRDRRRAA